MGSGAFLVQVCRYLSERLIEAWAEAEAAQPGVVLTIPGAAPDSGDAAALPIPLDLEERATLARRLIADRCLYGVDMNPLAVEMAKLSLWLVTLQRDRPFSFLDHALKCGDSLMGVTDVRQLEEFSLSEQVGAAKPLTFGSSSLRELVRKAVRRRELLESIPSDSALHVAQKSALHQQVEHEFSRARLIADVLVMGTMAHGGSLSEDKRYELMDKATSSWFIEHPEAFKAWRDEMAKDLKRENPGFTRPLHWALEFPEVFGRENGGFDVIVGNPPFLGSQRMREAIGHLYREYLVERIADGSRGQADFVAYFFLRAGSLIRPGGDFGLIATNTIAEGDTREVGLLRLENVGFVIREAWPNTPWPGQATVATSQVVIKKAMNWGSMVLPKMTCSGYSSFLTTKGNFTWEAAALHSNLGIGFIGTYVLGNGFLVNDEITIKAWINSDKKNKEVLFPYVIGDDTTSHPKQTPSRWVINFWDWTKEKASKYKEPFEQVERLVYPVRSSNKRKERREHWWHFAEKCPALYHAIGRGHSYDKHPKGWLSNLPPLPRIFVVSRVSKYGVFTFIANTYIMSEQLCVFSTEDAALFALLQSTIHHVWARKMCSTLETRLRYTPSSCFDTFARPRMEEATTTVLRDLGERLHQYRAEVMKDRWIGLTNLYNLIHSPDCHDADIEELRVLHEQLDVMVAQAYGWDDLDCSHGFREVDYLPQNDRMRHTIPEPTRLEILNRLTLLNKERWEEEQREDAEAGADKNSPKRGGKKTKTRDDQFRLA